jgi:hypothetical protein
MKVMFDYEHEMVKPAEAWLRSRALMVKREFPLPWGICDLVGCSFEQQNIETRLRLRQKKPIGSYFRLMLLSQIPEEKDGPPITLSRLTKVFSECFDSEQIRFELHRLRTDQFIYATSSNSFYKLNGWMPIHKRFVALELKLSRFHDVLCQAINNLEFADESYAALPLPAAANLVESGSVSLFVEHGIGIIGLDPQGYNVLRTARPSKATIDPLLQAHCAERFWRTYVKGNST